MTNLDLSADIIDVRDVIERIETLESEIETFENPKGYICLHDEHMQNKEELASLLSIMDELKTVGGGDEEWRNNCYPLTLIADSYFTEYARELLEDCGDIPKNFPHYIEIDWTATARNICGDYTSVAIDGATYWCR